MLDYKNRIKMHHSDLGGISNFSSVLKQLESDNIGVAELRLLKQEHTYLEKLRVQRARVHIIFITD